jgi:8-oxo-dGTP pyrophosphatase MutT (NUDIX family)
MTDSRQSPSPAADQVAPARPAATVILVRPAGAGFEVLMVRRLASASAFADVFVFPGGVVRDDDYAADPLTTDFSADEALQALTERGGWPPESAGLARAFYRAAVRELFEEAGVLLAHEMNGQAFRIPDGGAERWSEHRDALQSGRLTLSDLLATEQLAVDYRRLTYFSHWITPNFSPRRFDTRFFLAQMPEGQTAIHCQVETTEGVWITPRAALAGWDSKTFPLVFPTRKHLERLAALDSLADVLTFARTKQIRTLHPGHDIVAGDKLVIDGEEVTWW